MRSNLWELVHPGYFQALPVVFASVTTGSPKRKSNGGTDSGGKFHRSWGEAVRMQVQWGRGVSDALMLTLRKLVVVSQRNNHDTLFMRL